MENNHERSQTTPRRPTGFPSPAADYDVQLDLNVLLVRHPDQTFFVIVNGTSMEGVGIRAGDILLVDRREVPTHGSIIVARLSGKLLLKQLQRVGEGALLLAGNAAVSPVEVPSWAGFLDSVWGVVIYSIHPHLYPFPHISRTDGELS